MKVNGVSYRTIWIDGEDLLVIDQRVLPHRFEVVRLEGVESVCEAIRNMTVRGAGLIGVTAGYGMWLAARDGLREGSSSSGMRQHLEASGERLRATRPTARNLAYAVEHQLTGVRELPPDAGSEAYVHQTRERAEQLADEDAAFCRQIGEHGKRLIEEVAAKKHREGRDMEPVHILTHCNAGWLAFTDFGSALSPVYAAHDAGIAVHVWVDETRPRNQGASLTAWELSSHGVPHTLIADNVGGHLMQHGMVDMVLTGADRVTRCGDTANKIGTYLKALAAYANGVPMYIALPSSTFDFGMRDGVREIPIEERSGDEVRMLSGWMETTGEIGAVRICPAKTPARNWAFDVTPARLLTGLICERGVCEATEAGILGLFPEQGVPVIARSEDHLVKRSEDHLVGRSEDHLVKPSDGVIKYISDHRFEPIIEAVSSYADGLERVHELDALRTTLHDAGLIGENAAGIGYGNVSIRLGETFCISGSGTGKHRELGVSGYSVVTFCDSEWHQVVSYGEVRASSESMTHGAVYDANPGINVVVHVHSRGIFDALLECGWPRTSADVAYGTPEMAKAVIRLVSSLPGEAGGFVSAGHDEGIFVYGSTLSDVRMRVNHLFNRGVQGWMSR